MRVIFWLHLLQRGCGTCLFFLPYFPFPLCLTPRRILRSCEEREELTGSRVQSGDDSSPSPFWPIFYQLKLPLGVFFINSNSPWGPFRAGPSGYMFPCKESRGAPSQGKVVSQGKWAPCSLQPSVPYWELTHAKNFLFASHLDLIVTLFSWHCCYFSPHIWENWDTERLAPHHKAGREPTRRGQMSTVAFSSPCMTPRKGPLLPGNWCHLAAERMWGDSSIPTKVRKN